MKTFLVIILLSIRLYGQDNTMNLHGYDVTLGMNMMEVWENLKSGFNVVEEEDGTFYISDKNDSPIGVIIFKDEIAVKIIKDWGTTNKTNAGQVFKTLWNILKQHEKELENVKVNPIETFTPKGSKFTMQIHISETRYLEITIQHTVTILEVLEAKN